MTFTSQKGDSKLGAVVVICFIVMCVIFGYLYLGTDKKRADQPAPQHPQSKPAQTKPAQAGTLDLQFYSSSAKRTWTDQIVKEFNDHRYQVDGKVVRVQVHHVLSGDSLDNLKNGLIMPDIWSPGDESWLVMANDYWKDVKGKPLFEEFHPLLRVPLVIAMWEPMARALGYPNPIGWADLVKLARDPQGWASLGRPEWGKFRWGHAHPDANSGFLAVISLAYAAAGKFSDLSPGDLKNPAVSKFVQDAESSVENYGLSNEFIDKLMHDRGPAYLSAAVQYENTIIESNINHKNVPFKLVAIYPKEGAFWAQHPAVIPTESWVTAEKLAAAKLFLEFMLAPHGQQLAVKLGLRPADESKITNFFGPENGVMEQVPKIPVFTMPHESVLPRIRELWEDVKLPATIIVAIDRSGSMIGEPLVKAKEGAAAFIKSMKPRDQLELVAFSNRPEVLSPMCVMRTCGEQVLTKLEGLFAQGNTALYDTVQNSYKKLIAIKKADPHRRYGMVVLSDGQDTSSATKIHDFLDALPKPEDPEFPKIFTIAYGPEADKQLLAKIATKTNARMFVGTPKDIVKIYQELSANF